jgi:chemotaxis protein histidine kinase CheA
VLDLRAGYDLWAEQRKAAKSAATAASKAATAAARASAKPSSSKPAANKPSAAKPAPTKPAASKPSSPAKANPYARKFGRNSAQELERLMADTEAEIGALQSEMSDSPRMRDPANAKRLSAQLNTLTTTLAELEAEYLLRAGD